MITCILYEAIDCLLTWYIDRNGLLESFPFLYLHEYKLWIIVVTLAQVPFYNIICLRFRMIPTDLFLGGEVCVRGGG